MKSKFRSRRRETLYRPILRTQNFKCSSGKEYDWYRGTSHSLIGYFVIPIWLVLRNEKRSEVVRDFGRKCKFWMRLLETPVGNANPELVFLRSLVMTQDISWLRVYVLNGDWFLKVDAISCFGLSNCFALVIDSLSMRRYVANSEPGKVSYLCRISLFQPSLCSCRNGNCEWKFAENCGVFWAQQIVRVIIICVQQGGDNLSCRYAISLSVAPFEWTVAIASILAFSRWSLT